MDYVYIVMGYNDDNQNGSYTGQVYGAFSTEELAREQGDELVESEVIAYYELEVPKVDEFGWR